MITNERILEIAGMYVCIPRDNSEGVTVGELLNFARALLVESTDRQHAEKGVRPTTYHFHRYVSGKEMAQDILIERAKNIEEAVRAAVRCCPESPISVLVHAPTLKPWHMRSPCSQEDKEAE